MIRHIGYACDNQTLLQESKGKSTTNKTCRLKSFSIDKVSQLALENCQNLLPILKWNAYNKIKLFRVGSNMFPFMDHETLGYTLEQLNTCREITQALKEAGQYAKNQGIRLSMHPEAFTCIASPNPLTVQRSILTIRMHTLIAHLLGVEDFIINIHVGGSYQQDFEGTAKRFIESFKKLDSDSQKWLTLENDDSESLWTIEKLHHYIHKEIGIPLVIDLHHWNFCKEQPIEQSVALAFSTWGNRIPKIHYSESRDEKYPEAHSDYILNKIPDHKPDITYDCMVEAKQKELAVLRYRELYS